MAPKRKSTGDAPAGDKSVETKKKSKAALAIGDNVKDVAVELTNEEEKAYKFADLVEKNGIVVFMYPRANTGGCTKQALGFKEHYEAFKKAGYEIYGMSFDKSKSQKNWKIKYDLPYHLLTDDGTALKAFGAFKAPKNISRSHVVIEKGGKLLDKRNGISPGDSFTEALKTVTGKK